MFLRDQIAFAKERLFKGEACNNRKLTLLKQAATTP